MARPILPLTKELFESKVAYVPFSSCHYWAGQVNGQGYGMFRLQRAHRISYRLYKGSIPDLINGERAVIRHKCDTPLCVNPDHLEVGTQRQNMRDAAERKRMPQGVRHWNARLSDADIVEIELLLDAKTPPKEICERFNISEAKVSSIRHGGGRSTKKEKPTGRADRRISDESAADIFERMMSGESPSGIAADYGVKNSFVHDIKRGATYASVSGFRKAL